MLKKGIKIILLVLVFISFLVTLYGIYIIYSYDYKVDVTAQKVIEEINDVVIEDNVVNDKLNEENRLVLENKAIGVIIFESGKMVAIYNNPTDYNMMIGIGKIIDNSILNISDNSILLGHNDVGFTELKNIKVNDTFKIKTTSKEVIYKVTNTYITEKDDPNPYRSSDNIIVTLITCYPFNYIGDTNKRYVVVAKPI